MTTPEITSLLSTYKLPLHDEKMLQRGIEEALTKNGVAFEREHHLDKASIPDFFINGLAIEVKIKGSAKSIFRQIERYSLHPDVKEILLITNKTMGIMPELNGKRCYLLKLSTAWL